MIECKMELPENEVPKIKPHCAQIIVDGTAEKPYYNIMWLDTADKEQVYHIGYGSCCLEYVFNWLSEYFEIIEEQPTIEQPTWIPVTERLPDEHVDVQMCWKTSGTQATGFYMDESWCTYAEDGYYTDCEKAPTHWKAVGEPPVAYKMKATGTVKSVF